MCLLKDQLSKMLLLGDHQAVPKENNTSIINRETTSNTFGNVSLDPGNPRIMLLGFYDMIHKSRFRHQGRKESVRSNVKIKLQNSSWRSGWPCCNMRLLQYDLRLNASAMTLALPGV